MKAYPKIMSQLLGICLLQCLPVFLYAQFPNSGYTPLVPTTVGASVSPLVPVREEPVEQVFPVPYPLPPPPVPIVAPPQEPTESRVPLSRGPALPDKALDILDFWFGELPNPAYFPEDKLPIWFAASPEVDRQMREMFSQDVLNAARGEYNSWRETPRGRLALILLLDQFTRHIYRNRPQAFMFDQMARALVLEGLQRGDDKQLFPIERAFFYLPLEHSEDPSMQALSVAYYQQLLANSPEPLWPQMQSFLQSAILHQQQIARFGRFPNRNAILGRESTPEEIVFLNQWGRPSF